MAIGITKGLFYIYQMSSYRKQNPFKLLIEKRSDSKERFVITKEDMDNHSGIA